MTRADVEAKLRDRKGIPRDKGPWWRRLFGRRLFGEPLPPMRLTNGTFRNPKPSRVPPPPKTPHPEPPKKGD